MSAIRLHDLDEVATKRDLAELRVELAAFRSEMTSGLANLRAEFKSDFTHYSFILVGSCLAIIAALIGVGLFN